MQANDVREKYLKFFEKRGHKIILPAPLVLKDDPTTLFTSSGMQPLVAYLMGKPYPGGIKRLVDSQPSFRAGDIEEVGDNRHTTFFEMLGNWSLGDYFKKEQIPWFYEFLTSELGLPKEKLYVSIFEGSKEVPKDEESAKIWKSLGMPESHIFYYGDKKNWWSRSGTPNEMPNGEIGGPDSEVFFEFDSIKHDPKFGKECHPNCDCGRFLEIGNSVFMQYVKRDGKLVPLPKQNVDFGGGLERLTAATNNDPDVFKIDLFWEIIEKIEKITGKTYGGNEIAMRIIADHMRASIALISGGVQPANKLQGYILRRLIRRAALKIRSLKISVSGRDFKKLTGIDVIVYEVEKFSNTIEKGLSKMERVKESDINAKFAFDLFQSEGFPFEITQELAAKRGVKLSKEDFEKEMKEHQELSRKGAEKIFKVR